MVYLLIMFIIWTWGLTPTWVNIFATVICSLQIIASICEDISEIING